MFSEHKGRKIPVKLWCDSVESEANEQIYNLVDHPTTCLHVAAMPDCHPGYGMPIGGVIACDNAVIPNAVGVDIGCGMCFIETDIPAKILSETRDKQDRDLREIIRDSVIRSIPMGFKRHTEEQAWKEFNDDWPYNNFIKDHMPQDFNDILRSIAAHSLGTLGGGNHFIELQSNEKNNLCLMLHSGSRALGKYVCDFYNKMAKKLNSMWKWEHLIKQELCFLPVHSSEGMGYLEWVSFCLNYAKENRHRMMEEFKNITFNVIKKYYGNISIKILEEVDVHHNYAALENHFGKQVWIHRKGAIRARKDDIGIIPGSMGTPSYIVKGKANIHSLHSSPHGAGRKMSRKKAKQILTTEQVKKSMEGIVHVKMKGEYDEAPDAYKNISEVMKASEDLVEIISELKPICSMKAVETRKKNPKN